MSKGRTYLNPTKETFKQINKAFKLKPSAAREKKYDEQKRKAQRGKFCRCNKCKGMMTFVPNTNTLVCENIITKKKEKTLSDGSKTTVEIQERCGWVNVVEDRYIDYLNYLFDGVAPDVAVKDNEKVKEAV